MMEAKSLFNKEKDLLILYASALCSDLTKKLSDLFRCSFETEFISVSVFIKTFGQEIDFGGKVAKEDIQKFIFNHSYLE